jgi:hypothetical protein
MFDLAVAIFLLFFLILLCSLIALAFRTVRPKAKWGALASAIGLVVSVVFLFVANDKAERQAHEMGYLSAAEQRSAERARADAALSAAVEKRRAAERKAAEDQHVAEEQLAKDQRPAEPAKPDAARRAAEEKLATTPTELTFTAFDFPKIIDASRNNEALFRRDYYRHTFTATGIFDRATEMLGSYQVHVAFGSNAAVCVLSVTPEATERLAKWLAHKTPLTISGTIYDTMFGDLMLSNGCNVNLAGA